jgi:hypothetical protein
MTFRADLGGAPRPSSVALIRFLDETRARRSPHQLLPVGEVLIELTNY